MRFLARNLPSGEEHVPTERRTARPLRGLGTEPCVRSSGKSGQESLSGSPSFRPACRGAVQRSRPGLDRASRNGRGETGRTKDEGNGGDMLSQGPQNQAESASSALSASVNCYTINSKMHPTASQIRRQQPLQHLLIHAPALGHVVQLVFADLADVEVHGI